MEQDQRTSLRSIYELITFGQYAAAGERLERLRDASQESVALRQLLTLDIGEHLTACQTASGLLEQRPSNRVQAICLSVIGRVDCLVWRFDLGIGRLRQALLLAKDLNEPVLVAWAQGRLSHALLRSVSIESALPELSRLRLCGYAAGDAHTIYAVSL